MVEVTFYDTITHEPIITLEAVEIPESSIVNQTFYATEEDSKAKI